MNKLWNLVVLGVLLVSVAVTGCSKSQPPAVPAEAKTMVAREPLQNAAPLGVEIGYANIQGVKKKIGSLATLTDKGVNQYSGGKMLLSRGEGLGLDGLKSVLFIFDKEGVLAGVIMVLPKDPKGTFELLSPKYEKIENKIDSFMNNGYARLGKGDSFIEIGLTPTFMQPSAK